LIWARTAVPGARPRQDDSLCKIPYRRLTGPAADCRSVGVRLWLATDVTHYGDA